MLVIAQQNGHQHAIMLKQASVIPSLIHTNISRPSIPMLKQINSAMLTQLLMSHYTTIYNQNIGPHVLAFSAFLVGEYRINKRFEGSTINILEPRQNGI